jgi:hypothetical protein
VSREELGVLAEDHAVLQRAATLVARRAAPEEVFAAAIEEIGQLLLRPERDRFSQQCRAGGRRPSRKARTFPSSLRAGHLRRWTAAYRNRHHGGLVDPEPSQWLADDASPVTGIEVNSATAWMHRSRLASSADATLVGALSLGHYGPLRLRL